MIVAFIGNIYQDIFATKVHPNELSNPVLRELMIYLDRQMIHQVVLLINLSAPNVPLDNFALGKQIIL